MRTVVHANHREGQFPVYEAFMQQRGNTAKVAFGIMGAVFHILGDFGHQRAVAACQRVALFGYGKTCHLQRRACEYLFKGGDVVVYPVGRSY